MTIATKEVNSTARRSKSDLPSSPELSIKPCKSELDPASDPSYRHRPTSDAGPRPPMTTAQPLQGQQSALLTCTKAIGSELLLSQIRPFHVPSFQTPKSYSPVLKHGCTHCEGPAWSARAAYAVTLRTFATSSDRTLWIDPMPRQLKVPRQPQT